MFGEECSVRFFNPTAVAGIGMKKVVHVELLTDMYGLSSVMFHSLSDFLVQVVCRQAHSP